VCRMGRGPCVRHSVRGGVMGGSVEPPLPTRSMGRAGSNMGSVVSWGFLWLLAGRAERRAVGAPGGLCCGCVPPARGGWVWG